MSDRIPPDETPTTAEDRIAGDMVPVTGDSAPEDAPVTNTVPNEERSIYTPPIDIYETDEGLVLEADLPGVSTETLELQIQDNKLTLFGRVKQMEPEGGVVRHQEYGVGDFLRSFILSDEVDYDRISARMNNGVLRIVLPKASQAQPRRIEVSE